MTLLKQTLVAASSILILTGCANSVPKPADPVDINNVPVELSVYQPPLPAPIALNDVYWNILTGSPCAPATGKKMLNNGDWYYTTYTTTTDGIALQPLLDPAGNTIEVCGNVQQQIAELRNLTGGSFVVLAITPWDYEKLSGNLQEIKRYIQQQQEIILYYRSVYNQQNNASESVHDQP